jgi:hypothetical protein
MALACAESTAPQAPFTENLDIAVCHQSRSGFTLSGSNPFFPLTVGTQMTFEGRDGADVLRLVITVLDQTEIVAGVTTRVLEERESENGNLIEISRNFFTHTPDGTVCYFGEDVDIYENGRVVSHDGAWRAGVGGAVPGIFMPAVPAVGMAFRQEVAPGVAEDRAVINAMGESVTVPAGTYSNTLRFTETTPLEPGVTSTKVYVRGVGQIVDDHVRLLSKRP